jgi:phosphate starvation-inducible protein PhoH
MPTSFIRGMTIDEAVIIVDEFQNCNNHELDSIITRVGLDSKIHFSGDIAQSDLIKKSEKDGAALFLKILGQMESFETINFGIDDICRSSLVKEYIVAKHNLGLFQAE